MHYRPRLRDFDRRVTIKIVASFSLIIILMLPNVFGGGTFAGGQNSTNTSNNSTSQTTTARNSTSTSSDQQSTNSTGANSNSTTTTTTTSSSNNTSPNNGQSSSSSTSSNSTTASSSSPTGNVTSSADKPAENATSSDASSGSADNNSTSTTSSNENSTSTSASNQQPQNATSFEPDIANATAVEKPSQEIATLVTISGEPLVPAAKEGITRIFSYPILQFQGETAVEEKVTMNWNTDGATTVSDNRGYRYGITIPASQGAVKLLQNSTTVVQQVIGTGLSYDVYWTPVQAANGLTESYKYTIAGSSVNGSTISFKIEGTENGIVKDNSFFVEEPETVARANKAAISRSSPSLNWAPSSIEKSVDKASTSKGSDTEKENKRFYDGLQLDWSDAVASGRNVQFDASTSSINIPVGKSFVIDPTVVTTTTLTQSPPVNESFENEKRMVKTDNRTNVFYYDGSNIVYRTSDDQGATWSSAISTGSGTIASDTYRWSVTSTLIDDDTQYVSIIYFSPAGSNMNFYALRGTVSGMTISWGSPILLGFVTADSVNCGTGGACAAVTAATDNDGKIYVGLRWRAGGSSTYSFKVMNSTNGGLTWGDSLPQVNGFSTSRIPMVLTPLDEQKMLLAYAKTSSASIFYRVFNGTIWGAEQSISDSSLSTSSTVLKQLSAVTGDDFTAYVAYTNVTTGGAGGILKVAKFFGNGTYQATETADSTLRHSLPTILTDSSSRLYIDSIASGKVYHTVKSFGVWSAPMNPYGTTFTSPTELTATDHHSAFWKEGSASPYNMMFGIVKPNTIAQSSVQNSPSSSDYYEGERRVVGSVIDKMLYAFYYDGSNIVYKTSIDFGHSWDDMAVSTGTGQLTSSDNYRWTAAYTVYNGTERISLLYYSLSGSNTNFYAKTFSISNRTLILNSTTTLFSAANDASCSPTGVCATASGTSDSNGVLYAVFTYKTAGTWYMKIMKSTNGGQTWVNSLGPASIITTGNHVPITITKLNSTKMLLSWAKFDNSGLFYKVYNGSSWSASIQLYPIGWCDNCIKQISSGTVTNGSSTAYVAYVTSGKSGSLKVATFFGNGTFRSIETADTTLSHTLPSIAANRDGMLHVYTLVNSKTIYDTSRNSTAWLAPIMPYGNRSSFYNPEQITSQLGGIFNSGVMWRSGNAAPYDLYYDGTTGGTVITTYARISPGVTNAYEGEKRIVRTPDAIFAFWYSCCNIKYKVSTDSGASWSSIYSTSSGKVNNYSYKWTIATTTLSLTKYITLLYFKTTGINSETTTFYAKRGTVSGSSITWGLAVSLYTVNNKCSTCIDANSGITTATDSNGYIHAALQWYDPSFGYFLYRIMQSTDAGSSWTTTLSDSLSWSSKPISMALTDLASGKMLFVWAKYDDGDIRYQVFSGSWGGGNTISASTTGLLPSVYKQITADSDTTRKPYLAFVTGGTYGTLKVISWDNAGNLPAVEIVDAIRSHRLPSITIRPDNDVINIYTQSFGKGDTVRQIYLTTKVNGYWLRPHKPYGDSGISTNQLTIGWGLGGEYAAITWADTTISYTTVTYTLREMGIFRIVLQFPNSFPPACPNYASMPPAGTRCTHSDSFTGYPGTFQYTTPMGFLISDPQAASCKNPPPGVLYGDYRLSMPSGMTALTLTFAWAIHQGLIPSYGASFEWEPDYYTTFDTSSDSGIPGNRFKILTTHCIAPQVYTEFFDLMYYTNGLQWRMIIYSPSLGLGYKL